MDKNDKSEAIAHFKRVIEYLKHRQEHESVGLDIEGVEELTVIDYKSRGYSKPAKIRDAKKVHLEKLDFSAPTIEAVIPLYEGILRGLKAEDKPEGSTRARVESILKKLAPYGSWMALAYTVLHNCGII